MAEIPPAAESSPHHSEAAARSRMPATLRALAAVALGLAVLGLIGWLDLRREVGTLRQDAAQRLTAAEAALAQGREREARQAGDLRDAQAKLALLEARVAESQSQQAALETLYRELSPSRDDLALTEVEQILLIANQQLTLAGNVPAALGALQLADAKLARIDRPQLAPLRRVLARDVERLQAVPYVDVEAIAAKLDQAITLVDVLPLARDERLAAATAAAGPDEPPAWRRALAEAWREVRNLVRLEVSDRPAAPFVPPEQAYYLRENLRLRLLSARIAILAQQDASFKADVRAAQAWVRQYFDLRARPVQVVADALAAMQAEVLAAALPDLAGSLDAVRALKGTAERRGEPPLRR